MLDNKRRGAVPLTGPRLLQVGAWQMDAAQFRTVSGDLIVTSDLRLLELAESGAPTVAVLTGVEHLVAVGGSVEVDGTLLRDLRGLEALQHVGKSLVLKANPRLETLRGLHNLQYVGGQLAVRSVRGRFGACGEISAVAGQDPIETPAEL